MCDERQLQVARYAQRMAFVRVTRAQTIALGLNIPGATPMPSQIPVVDITRRLLGVDYPDMTAVAENLDTMKSFLANANLILHCCTEQEPSCRRGYTAFVESYWPPIHLCPQFFDPRRTRAEVQIRAFVHEAAHLAGIGTPNPINERYVGIFDGVSRTSNGELDADNWSHLVHTLLRLPTDEIVLRPRRRPRPPLRR